jgi:ribose transport system ATP-binding protein
MDEPTAALTSAEAERLFRVLAEIRRSRGSVLYVSHRLDEVMRFCDRVTVLRDGAVIATKPVAETSQDDIIRMMIGRRIEGAYPPPLAPSGSEVCLTIRSGGREVRLHRGEIVGLAGLAGAGQSEVLRRAMGEGAGLVEVAGPSGRRAASLRSAWKSGLAYVPGERRAEGLVLSRPIYENVTLPHLDVLSLKGAFLTRRRERTVAAARGREVRLKALGPRQLCLELSGGNQQKVVFARALAGAPKVLLLDEPTRGVDVGARFDIYSVIRELAAKGAAVLIASSDFPELIGLCDRIAVMRGGEIAEVLNSKGLSEEALFRRCVAAPSGATVGA